MFLQKKYFLCIWNVCLHVCMSMKVHLSQNFLSPGTGVTSCLSYVLWNQPKSLQELHVLLTATQLFSLSLLFYRLKMCCKQVLHSNYHNVTLKLWNSKCIFSFFVQHSLLVSGLYKFYSNFKETSGFTFKMKKIM